MCVCVCLFVCLGWGVGGGEVDGERLGGRKVKKILGRARLQKKKWVMYARNGRRGRRMKEGGGTKESTIER